MRADVAPLGLQARIEQAEQRLMQREERMRGNLRAVGQRARQWWQPRKLALAAAGGVLAVGGAWWLLRRRRLPAGAAAHAGYAEPPRHAHRHAGAGAASQVASHFFGRGAAGPLPWVSLIGLVWPMLPNAWRSRVSPATVSTALAVAPPLLQALRSLVMPERGAAMPPLATVPGPLAIERFTGRWYEVAWLPASRVRGAGPHPLDLQPAGSGLLQLHEPGRPEGVLRAGDDGNAAQLLYSDWPAALRWLMPAWRPLGVLHLDAGDTELLLGSPGRDELRVLSRRPNLSPTRLQAMVQMARQNGFAIERIQGLGGSGDFDGLNGSNQASGAGSASDLKGQPGSTAPGR